MSDGGNIDQETVRGFGEEWAAYDQTDLPPGEHSALFENYFSTFPLDVMNSQAEGFDLGCGSGRWAEPVAARVRLLHCIDPSEKALAVARKRLAGVSSARFHLAGADSIPLADASQDFGYSLGVLHHVPDTAAAMADCVRKLKFGAPFLVYLYYRFDNRPWWFKAVWRASDFARGVVSKLPFGPRRAITSLLAALVYWPLGRLAGVFERAGLDVANMPLSFYRHSSFYTMRTDALDRFGTRLEQRFTRPEIALIMEKAGLIDIRFREEEPFWVACGRRAT